MGEMEGNNARKILFIVAIILICISIGGIIAGIAGNEWYSLEVGTASLSIKHLFRKKKYNPDLYRILLQLRIGHFYLVTSLLYHHRMEE